MEDGGSSHHGAALKLADLAKSIARTRQQLDNVDEEQASAPAAFAELYVQRRALLRRMAALPVESLADVHALVLEAIEFGRETLGDDHEEALEALIAARNFLAKSSD